MKNLTQWVSKIKKDEAGQGLVEYVLILALISVVAVASMNAVGTAVVSTFTKVVSAL